MVGIFLHLVFRFGGRTTPGTDQVVSPVALALGGLALLYDPPRKLLRRPVLAIGAVGAAHAGVVTHAVHAGTIT